MPARVLILGWLSLSLVYEFVFLAVPWIVILVVLWSVIRVLGFVVMFIGVLGCGWASSGRSVSLPLQTALGSRCLAFGGPQKLRGTEGVTRSTE